MSSVGPPSPSANWNNGFDCTSKNGKSFEPSAASFAGFASPSSIRSWITIDTQKMISSMHGFEIVESMYSDDVELYLTWLGAGPATCAGPRSRASSALCSFFLCPGTLIPSSS